MKTANLYQNINSQTYNKGYSELVKRLAHITDDNEYDAEHERLAINATNGNLSGLTIQESYYLICFYYGAERGNSFLASHAV